MYEQPVNQGAVAGTYSRSAAVVGPVGRWPTSILTIDGRRVQEQFQGAMGGHATRLVHS